MAERAFPLSLLGALAISLTSCLGSSPPPALSPVYFEHQEEAGSVQVGIQSVAPFEEYVDSLQPRFAVDEKQALAEAISLTRIEELRELRALLAKIAVALPSTTQSIQEVLTRTNDDVESSRTETTTESSGTAPAASAPTLDSTLTGVPTAPAGTVAIDAAFRYRTAAALFQDVALLSSYVREAAVSPDTTPYIVRLLVTALPSARLAPYDAYSSVSFFLDVSGEPRPYLAQTALTNERIQKVREIEDADKYKFQCDGREVQVIPLFVTDNVESTSSASALESIRGTEASAGGVVAGVGLGGGVTAKTDTAAGSRGLDINGIQTVALTSPNTVQLRLGAAATGRSFRGVPRTYNLTTLVLVPSRVAPEMGVTVTQEGYTYADPAEVVLACGKLRFVAQSQFRATETGVPLEVGPRAELLKSLDAILRDELGLSSAIDISAVVDAAAWTDYSTFLASLKTANQSAAKAQALWPRVVSLVSARGASRGSIPLPQATFKFFPNPRPTDPKVPILDDGETARVVLYGGERLEKKTIHGGLTVAIGGQAVVIDSTSVDVTPDRRGATVIFPSLKGFVDKITAPAGVTLPPTAEITVGFTPTLQRWSRANRATWTWRQNGCPILLTKPEEKPKPKPEFAIRATTAVVQAKADGTGEIALEIKKTGSESRQVLFNVTGAIITRTSPVTTPVGAYHAGQTDNTYAVALRGLLVGSTVKIHSWRLQDKEPAHAPDIELVVVPAPSTKSTKSP